MALHLAMLFAAAWAVVATPERPETPPLDIRRVVFLERPGPSGGGGGNPAPAPPRPLEVPRAHPPAPVPVTVVVTPPPVPAPTLVTPITTNADLLQSSGRNSVSLAPPGGGGNGPTAGPGSGIGIGPGRDRGFGDGPLGPGSGVVSPTLVRELEPKYTSRAMQAKIQGIAEVEAVVLPNGTVGDVRLVKSLDPLFGLDDEALNCAKLWLFRPGRDRDGRAVPSVVRIQLEFVLR